MYEQGNLDTIWCVIPVYNNGQTIRSIALECREQLTNVLVIDDGSTDVDLISLLSDTDITIVRHQVNQGKGKALLTALDYVAEKDARYMITVDGDGQHQASDLEGFFSLIENDEDSFVIGCRDFTGPEIPNRSKFGRKVANFWLSVETGVSIRDCQSGFRAYPVKHFQKLKFCGTYYDFETEALARAAWAGLNLKMVEIGVLYPEKEKRISSFRPFVDNFRISVMHSRLVLRRMLPMPHKKLVSKKKIKLILDFSSSHSVFKKIVERKCNPRRVSSICSGWHYSRDITASFYPYDRNNLCYNAPSLEQGHGAKYSKSGPEIPNRSKFGRKVANFWLSVETGVSIRDCQSGFRAYPVKHFQKLKFCGTYYDFETEALARAAWAGLNLKMIEIGVLYPEKEKRISSFRPFVDNFRISVMHSRLVLRRMLPMPHKKLVSKKKIKLILDFFFIPFSF
jgi:glycosyltransferase involved in cell wall biosynthesis